MLDFCSSYLTSPFHCSCVGLVVAASASLLPTETRRVTQVWAQKQTGKLFLGGKFPVGVDNRHSHQGGACTTHTAAAAAAPRVSMKHIGLNKMLRPLRAPVL